MGSIVHRSVPTNLKWFPNCSHAHALFQDRFKDVQVGSIHCTSSHQTFTLLSLGFLLFRCLFPGGVLGPVSFGLLFLSGLLWLSLCGVFLGLCAFLLVFCFFPRVWPMSHCGSVLT